MRIKAVKEHEYLKTYMATFQGKFQRKINE